MVCAKNTTIKAGLHELSAGDKNPSGAIPNTALLKNPASTAEKRFKPLISKNKVNPEQATSAPIKKNAEKATQSQRTVLSKVSLDANRYLEFPSPAPVPSLTTISLPPPLMQRKKVQRWAIILSQVEEEDCKQCALVSRTFRYASTPG